MEVKSIFHLCLAGIVQFFVKGKEYVCFNLTDVTPLISNFAVEFKTIFSI